MHTHTHTHNTHTHTHTHTNIVWSPPLPPPSCRLKDILEAHLDYYRLPQLADLKYLPEDITIGQAVCMWKHVVVYQQRKKTNTSTQLYWVQQLTLPRQWCIIWYCLKTKWWYSTCTGSTFKPYWTNFCDSSVYIIIIMNQCVYSSVYKLYYDSSSI